VAEELARTRRTHRGRELVHLHYPEPSGGKSEQLNFALAEILRRLDADGTPLDDVYFVVYDADSQPDLRAATYVARECAELRCRGEPLPALFQQVPLPLRRPASARPGAVNRLARTYALWHVRRGLAVEVDRLLRYGRGRRLPPGSLLRTAANPWCTPSGPACSCTYRRWWRSVASRRRWTTSAWAPVHVVRPGHAAGAVLHRR
jgi:hypothetical protein